MTTVYPTQNINTPTLSSATLALATNANRIGWMIQNCGTNPLYVLMGSGASSSAFHVALAAGTASSDGKGGLFIQNSTVCYTGIVTTSGTGATYTITELAP